MDPAFFPHEPQARQHGVVRAHNPHSSAGRSEGLLCTPRAVLSRRVKRQQLDTVANLPACVIGMDACGSAHYWGRAFEQVGHRVKLMSPRYVRPYVKTNKNDRRDAEAICEAVGRPTMRVVSIKTVEQADMQALHRTRSLFVKHRTLDTRVEILQLLIQLRDGVSGKRGQSRLRIIEKTDEGGLDLLRGLSNHQSIFGQQAPNLIDHSGYRTHPICRKLAAVPGIGPLTATALLATIGRPQAFQNGRHLAAWLGLVPRQYSSGGKEIFGGISKRGSRYVRMLLIHGARAVVQRAARRTDMQGQWLCTLMRRKGTNVAAVALANKNARVIWAMLAHDEEYRQPA